MSNIIYVVPWAICNTDSIYVKKVPSDAAPAPVAGQVIDDWCIMLCLILTGEARMCLPL